MHLIYAVKKTKWHLATTLRSSDDYIIMVAFAIVLLTFGAMQVALFHNSSISETIISTMATATIFFFSFFGFIAFTATVVIFAYYFSTGNKTSSAVPHGRAQVWRLVLSFALSGLVIGAVFNSFCDGLEQISFVRTQYAFFLPNGG